MIREVYPSLFVGDGESINGSLKAMAGYHPGQYERTCRDCGAGFLGRFDYRDDETPRCLDCALKHIAEDWFIIHAAKEKWHREALGYTSRGAPADHPEYLVARRPGELMLNLVDMPKLSEQYTNPIFEAAFEAIDTALADGKQVLVHCNEGKSRAPTIALLWMGSTGGYYPDTPFDKAMEAFRNDLYPEYDPGAGVEAYARARWGFVEEASDVQP